MILVLGVGVVGKAVIEYYKNKSEVCFYDDKVNEYLGVPRFKSWDNIDLVVASPGIALRHDMMQEAIRRGIKITNDIEIFLRANISGKKIGVTGTNGKSTTCAMLQHVLKGYSINGRAASVQIGGNFGVSPLDFLHTNNAESALECADFYVLELSSYQLEIMSVEELHMLDIGVITNIYPSHLTRHGDFDDYVSAKCKILSAKNKILGHCNLFNDWDFPKAQIPEVLPDSLLFERIEYKYCWGIVNMVLDLFGLDKTKALEFGKTYESLAYRQQVVQTNPITVINDSKSTNSVAALLALKNMRGAFCWLAGGAGQSDWSKLHDYLASDVARGNIKRVYLTAENNDLIAVLKNAGVEYILEPNFDVAVKNAYEFALANNLTLLFSPGYQSFDRFKNFEERGAIFNSHFSVSEGV